MSERVLAALLFVAFSMVSAGVGWYSPGAGVVAGGLLLAVWSWLVFGDVDVPGADGEVDG